MFLEVLCSMNRCRLVVRSFSNHPTIVRMRDKAVVKHVEGEERFTFSFIFKVKSNSPGRQFNLSRSLVEDSSVFVNRIQANVEKIANKKTKKQVHVDQEIKVRFSDIDGALDLEINKTAQDLIFTPGVKMSVNEEEYEVQVNPPVVEEVKISEPMLTDTLLYPAKLRTLFAAEEHITWFVNKDPAETSPSVSGKKKVRLDSSSSPSSSSWEKRAHGFFFRPENKDIGGRVRLDVTPTRGEVLGDTMSIYSSSLVEAGPDTSATLNRQAFTKTNTSHPILRVMTYNILADLYADSDFSRENLFPQCPHFALEYQYRVRLIINELVNFHPDIICLQETDRKVFKHDLLPVLERLGFDGQYCKKGGQVDEGLSLFYRKNRFRLLHTVNTVMNENLENPKFAHIWGAVKENAGLVERLMKRTTAVSLAVLQSVQDEGKLVIVSNTHLYFKPDADHIRLLQIEMCLTEIKALKSEMEAKYPESSVAVLQCGDFNSTPPFGVLKYCTEGEIAADYPDWNSCPEEKISGFNIRHNFNLGSATGTPKYTNYTAEFKDCLDYIFYDKSQFTVDQVIPFPSDDELSLNVALPNVSFPSDHISCVADLKWIDNQH